MTRSFSTAVKLTQNRHTRSTTRPPASLSTFQNAGGAFLLGVAPDNTLRGSGSTSVNGKLVSSIRGDNVSFIPHSESCNVGTLGAGSKRTPCVPPAVRSQPRHQPIQRPRWPPPQQPRRRRRRCQPIPLLALRVSAPIFESCWIPPSPEPTRLSGRRYSSCASRSATSSESWALPYLPNQLRPRR